MVNVKKKSVRRSCRRAGIGAALLNFSENAGRHLGGIAIRANAISRMADAMTIALSGLNAATLALSATASNVANANSAGPVPAAPPTEPVPPAPGSVYQPVAAIPSAVPGGGVAASLQASLPGYMLAYDPKSPFANLQGMIAVPNIDLATEFVSQIQAVNAFRANLAVYRTASGMVRSLLRAVA
jgi:flagellar basal-body rod protein FlgC